MWDTFWPDTLVAVIGASLTVAIAYCTFLIQQSRQEKQVFRGLINDLHHRRALSIGHPQRIPGAEERKDFQRASMSVIDVRDHVRRARDQIRQDSPTQKSLSDKIRACNRYLEESEAAPDFYGFHLKELSQDLDESISEISQRVSGIEALPAGAAAF